MSKSISSTVVLLLAATVAWGQQFHQNQNLSLSSPAAGTILHPGQSFVVHAIPTPGAYFPNGVAVIAEMPLQTSIARKIPPYDFVISIPGFGVTPRPYRFRAISPDNASNPPNAPTYFEVPKGVDPTQVSAANLASFQASSTLAVQVELTERVYEIRVDPPLIHIKPGGSQTLQVLGRLNSGSGFILLNQSSYTSYEIRDPSLATIDSTGLVTATDQIGRTSVVIRYKNPTGGILTATVPLFVQKNPSRTIERINP